MHSCSFETLICCEGLKAIPCHRQEVPGRREAPPPPGALRTKPGKQRGHSVREGFPVTSLNLLFPGIVDTRFWSACFGSRVLCCSEAVKLFQLRMKRSRARRAQMGVPSPLKAGWQCRSPHPCSQTRAAVPLQPVPGRRPARLLLPPTAKHTRGYKCAALCFVKHSKGLGTGRWAQGFICSIYYT